MTNIPEKMGNKENFNQAVFRTTTQCGEFKTKHYLIFTDKAIFIKKLVLTPEPPEIWRNYELVKKFKDHNLYMQIFAAKHSTFINYMEIFVQYKNNEK